VCCFQRGAVSAPCQMANVSDMSLVERSSAAKKKYQVGELLDLPPYMKGTHPLNRQIQEDKVLSLCYTILDDGWDSDEEGGTVIQEKPGSHYILDHNKAMVDGSAVLPQFGEYEKVLSYGTVEHGHQNWSLRCFYFGNVPSDHAEHRDSSGCLSMNVVRSRRPMLISKVTKGPKTRVCSHETPLADIRVMIEAANLKNSAVMEKHCLEVLEDLHRVCVAQLCLGLADIRDRVLLEFRLTNKEIGTADFNKYYGFACRFGPIVKSISTFHAIACPEGRTLPPDFISTIARFPVDMRVLVEAFAKANLAGPRARGKFADNISRIEVESYLPMGAKHQQGVEMIQERFAFMELFGAYIAQLPGKRAALLEGSLDKNLVDVMMEARSAAKGGYAEVKTHARTALLAFLKSSGLEIPSTFPDMPATTSSGKRKFAVLDYAQPVAFNVEGSPPITQCLADRGIVAGAFVKYAKDEKDILVVACIHIQ
jgi:hypothetical protein